MSYNQSNAGQPGTYAKSVTPAAITVHFLDGKSFHWPSTHPQFGSAKKLVSVNAPDDEVRSLMDISGQIARAVSGQGNVTVSRDGVFYKGQPVHMVITERILAFQSEGADIAYLIRFLENLFQNPIRDSVLSMYDFLETNRIPITPDGCFLAYKKVRDNYMDIHSGTFDNSVGANPKVESWQVDPDRTQECSRGLHVCAREYLPSFGSGPGNRVVVCKINPAHVVAVPRDYNYAKMRVCEYLVVGELTDEDKASIFDTRQVIRPGEDIDHITWDEALIDKAVDDELKGYDDGSADSDDCLGDDCPGIDDEDCCEHDDGEDDQYDQYGNRRW